MALAGPSTYVGGTGRRERLIVPPTTLKKFATGSGKADKNEMIAALPVDVREHFNAQGYKKTTGLTDVADAYWLSTYAK